MSFFFSFDGIDGVGKSTQLRLFSDWLRERGRPPIVCRDPGGTALGERVRDILLAGDHPDTLIGPRSEMLLYMAARAQLVDEVIRPALQAGRTVVCDRYLLANVVYQGHAGGVPVEAIRQVGSIAVGGIYPDCTFLLDMDPVAALQRLGRRLDRVESRGPAYRERLRAGFLAEAAEAGPSIRVIDADRDVQTVHAEIVSYAAALLSRGCPTQTPPEDQTYIDRRAENP
jgi:dTMP kinase